MKAISAMRSVVAVVLAFFLTGSIFYVAVEPSWADELTDAQIAVDNAQSVLNTAEAQMSQITEEYNELSSEIESLQDDIDELAEEILVVQDTVIEGRNSLGNTMQYEYRSSGTLSMILSVLLESKSFQELLQNAEYLSQIIQYQASEIAAQKERRQQLEDLSSEISANKDAQEDALATLEDKRAEAQQVVNSAQAQLATAEAEQESARLAALQAQAAQIAQQEAQDAQEVAISSDATTIDRGEVVSDDTPVISDSGDTSGVSSSTPSGSSSTSSTSGSSSTSSTSSSNDYSGSSGSTGTGSSTSSGTTSNSSVTTTTTDTSSSSGWLTGIASAYGGSTDPSTPNPGVTATGAICDDNSMGVAVPMSLPNYRSYFGRTVEISYGGMTVYATVNDCGSMGGGSRALDLQPGVWKAFGFSSCSAWGLRTVNYRFL